MEKKNFMDAIDDVLDEEYNYSVTENGALGYKTTKHSLLDMNFKVNSYRHMSEEEIIDDFINAYNEDKVNAVKWAFYARDVREGLGERRLFRVIMKFLATAHPEIVSELIPLIAEYGRWDDVLELYSIKEVKNTVVELIRKTLLSDMQNIKENKPITLLAKWIPSINTSSAETHALARSLMIDLGIDSEKHYRKMLSALRGYLKVVEKQMSANNWDEINYEAVPSKANLLYKDAFMKHDEERRTQYLDSLSKGEAKINSSVNYPSDIVHKYSDFRTYGYYHSNIKFAVDPTLEGLWKALPDYGIEDTICVADGSGSMTCVVDPHSSVQALEVANALAIYCAEHCKGEFKNKYITFSANPQLVNLNGETLADNLREAYTHSECANTNIKAVFELILSTAVKNHMTQEELPKNILILSDMEWDCCATTDSGWSIRKPDARLFEVIAGEYAKYGYKLPRLIFWNINSRTGTIPVKENDLGVALVSGYSVNTLKMVLSGELDPYKLLLEVLSSKRYDAVEKAIR